MRRSVLTVIAIGLAFVAGHLLTSRQASVLGQNMGSGFAAVPGARGGQDLTGPYDVDPDWPKPMSQLPNHQNWTWGAVQGIFAESPDRVFIIQRGELPFVFTNLKTGEGLDSVLGWLLAVSGKQLVSHHSGHVD